MRFTLVGAGAIGGTMAAYLTRAGVEITLVDTARDHVDAMKASGLTVDAFDGSFVVPVSALHSEELTGRLEVVLLAVKGQHTEPAVASILPLLGPDSVVVSLQNGLEEHRLVRLVGRERTVGALVNFSADYIEPGRIRYAGAGTVHLGELDGRITSRLEALARELGRGWPVGLTSDIWGFLWGKMGYITANFASVAAGQAQAETFDRYRRLAVELATEVYEVAAREGVCPQAFDGVEPALYYPREAREWPRIDAAMERLLVHIRTNQKAMSGAWRDIAVRRRRSDVDATVRPALDIGQQHGLELPLTRELVRMIREIEDGQREFAWENLDRLDAMRLRLYP